MNFLFFLKQGTMVSLDCSLLKGQQDGKTGFWRVRGLYYWGLQMGFINSFIISTTSLNIIGYFASQSTQDHACPGLLGTSVEVHGLDRDFFEILVVHAPQLLSKRLLSPALAHPQSINFRVVVCGKGVVIEGDVDVLFLGLHWKASLFLRHYPFGTSFRTFYAGIQVEGVDADQFGELLAFEIFVGSGRREDADSLSFGWPVGGVGLTGIDSCLDGLAIAGLEFRR